MNGRLLRLLGTLIISFAFVVNASAMMAVQARGSVAVAMVQEDMPPCDQMAMPDATHDCCKQLRSGKATCVSNCCTSVVPYRFDVFHPFVFIAYRYQLVRLSPLHDRICDPPSKPPSV